MKFLKVSLTIITGLMIFGLGTNNVSAEEKTECTTTTGSYGQSNTTCRVLGETTINTHKTVNAGVGDVSFLLVAEILSVVGLGTFGLAKLAERTYWFD